MGPKRGRPKKGETGVADASTTAVPIDPAAQAAYLAAQLAVPQQRAGEQSTSTAAAKLGRTSSGHCTRLSAGGKAAMNAPAP